MELSKAYGCRMINLVMRSLYKADAWLSREDAIDVAHALLQFIRAYFLSARLAYDADQAMFSCIPKLHAMHEIWAEMIRQIDLSQWVLNPCIEMCPLDEDFVGRTAILTRSVSPRIISRRAIQRYLAQINVLWARA